MLNSDAWAPKIPDENGVTAREPVSGALGERLRRDSMCEANGGAGCETYYLGKPFPSIWEKVKCSLPAGSRVLMVGRNVPVDELEADEKALGIRLDWYICKLREIKKGDIPIFCKKIS